MGGRQPAGHPQWSRDRRGSAPVYRCRTEARRPVRRSHATHRTDARPHAGCGRVLGQQDLDGAGRILDDDPPPGPVEQASRRGHDGLDGDVAVGGPECGRDRDDGRRAARRSGRAGRARGGGRCRCQQREVVPIARPHAIPVRRALLGRALPGDADDPVARSCRERRLRQAARGIGHDLDPGAVRGLDRHGDVTARRLGRSGDRDAGQPDEAPFRRIVRTARRQIQRRGQGAGVVAEDPAGRWSDLQLSVWIGEGSGHDEGLAP